MKNVLAVAEYEHVIEGYNISISCYLTEGYPSLITSVEWTVDDHSLGTIKFTNK